MKIQSPLMRIMLAFGVIAVLAGAIALHRQQSGFADLRKENALIRNAIDKERSGLSRSEQDHRFAEKDLLSDARRGKQVDWKWASKVLSFTKSKSNGPDDPLGFLKLRARIAQMDRQGLLDAFDEIDAMDLSSEDRGLLERVLFDRAYTVAPDLALSRFIDRMHEVDGLIASRLPYCLREWMKQDPQAALVWFDAEVARGTFESRRLDGRGGASRHLFEAQVIGLLLPTDPVAVNTRLEALPSEQVGPTLGFLLSGRLPPAQQSAVVDLIRKYAPADQQARIVGSHLAGMSAGKDFESIEALMNRIDATAIERQLAIEQIGHTRFIPGHSNVEATYENFMALVNWGDRQVLGSADAIASASVGAMLDDPNAEGPWKNAADIALRYVNDGGSERVLHKLITLSFGSGHKERLPPSLDQIGNPETRTRIKNQYNLE